MNSRMKGISSVLGNKTKFSSCQATVNNKKQVIIKTFGCFLSPAFFLSDSMPIREQ